MHFTVAPTNDQNGNSALIYGNIVAERKRFASNLFINSITFFSLTLLVFGIYVGFDT